MKALKTIAAASLLLSSLVFSSNIYSQGPAGQGSAPVSWLVEGDIDRFIETMPKLRTEFEKLGLEHEADPNVWVTHAKAQEILSSYGWDYMTFGPKWAAIVAGYSYTKMSAELEQMPADQKAQAEQYMGTMLAQYKMSVHENDIALIKSKMASLDALFESM
jgi:hypothetical protein